MAVSTQVSVVDSVTSGCSSDDDCDYGDYYNTTDDLTNGKYITTYIPLFTSLLHYVQMKVLLKMHRFRVTQSIIYLTVYLLRRHGITLMPQLWTLASKSRYLLSILIALTINHIQIDISTARALLHFLYWDIKTVVKR